MFIKDFTNFSLAGANGKTDILLIYPLKPIFYKQYADDTYERKKNTTDDSLKSLHLPWQYQTYNRRTPNKVSRDRNCKT